jgi:hypothetical protein
MLTGHKSIYSLTYELLLFWYRSFIVYLGQEATNERSIAILAPGRFLFFIFSPLCLQSNGSFLTILLLGTA